MVDEEPVVENEEYFINKIKSSHRMHVRHLLFTPELQNLLERLKLPTAHQSVQIGAEDPSHKLILECNEMTVEIDDDIAGLHRELTAKYSKKFPELEKLVPNALDYARTVKRIGNEGDLTTVDLSDILPSSIIMVATISGSTSDGHALSPEDSAAVVKLCDEMIGLDEAKSQIVQYIASRMNDICPNLSAVVGSDIAARLVGMAGGIVQLSKLPSSVVQVLGQRKDVLHGLSTASIHAHQGFIHSCPLVTSAPPSLRTRAVRLLSGKCTLAARVDSYQESPDGSVGAQFRSEIEKRLEKLQEPPPAKQPKPLPVPEDHARKRRGGRRARAMKDKYSTSDMRKQANRVKFGMPETGDDFDPTSEGLGLLTAGSGKIRVSAKESKLASKLLQKKKHAKQYSSGATSGLSSSLAFTAVQGLELNNPLAQTPKPDDKYFGTTSSFFHAPKRVKKN
eukprot:c9078_g1_i1.p1 GENE.c9078_g1_i1~~c9078_g1_i1.p1  ORF type:complete len:491 (+),score=102.51 c9078_g1_i1:122-1474(+)